MGTNIYEAYEISAAKRDNGVAAVIRGMNFTIASITTPNYATELAAAHGACGDNCKKCPNNTGCETTALSKSVLLGWADIDDEGDDPLAYSAANAKIVLDAIPEFKMQVFEFANDLSNFV